MCKDPKDNVKWTVTQVEGRARLTLKPRFEHYDLNACNVKELIKVLKKIHNNIKECVPT